MEFEKDSELIRIIDSILELKEECFKIRINNNNLNWTEYEFKNFMNSISNTNLEENIKNEVLEIEDEVGNILLISDISNILKYCNSNIYDNINNYKWVSKNIVYNNVEKDLLDYHIYFDIIKESNIDKEPENWKINKKRFKITKRFSYFDKNNNIEYSAILERSDDEYYNTLKNSNILKKKQDYKFEININNENKELIIQSILNLLHYITLYPKIITRDIQKNVLQNYNNLIKEDVKIMSYNKKNTIPLLAPKPITLEKVNLISPKEYGSVSILEGYTVTEKADGERLLMYIDNIGDIYMINNTYNVINTGMTSLSNLYNSLIDGEYVTCDKRKDNSSKHLFAAFDMYYIKGKNITNLPLIGELSRLTHLNFSKSYIQNSKTNVEFSVKKFLYNDKESSIYSKCNEILSNYKSYPYEIDGLIFTPAKLSLYSYYANKPVQITDNVRWDRLFKWKPPEQNTIDFLVKYGKIVTENGEKYRELKLFVGYNSSQWEDIGPNKGLRLRYDYKYAKEQRNNLVSYIPTLFKPTIYYESGIEIAYVKINSKGSILTHDNQFIEDNSIIEFSYDVNDKISINHRWNPLRVRDDKTRLYKKGEISKTMNDLNIAINVWRSIHNSITNAMIIGNQDPDINNIYNNTTDKILESDDVYYSRNIPRDSLLSIHMLNFHNQAIKKKLYEYSKDRNSLLELCGGEGGDMNRWIEYNYSFILSIDLVKKNIYNPRSGGYSRLIKKKNQTRKISKDEKVYFPDIVFVAGDCSESINNGNAAKVINDNESYEILNIVMNRSVNNQYHLRHIAGKGTNKFSVCSCQFAIHYFFETEKKLNGFFANVANNLKLDGIFFATFMDGNIIDKLFKTNKTNTIKGIKNIEQDTEVITWAITKNYVDNEERYGKQIGVFIENTQKIIPEYLVDLDLLIEKATEYNLEFVETNTFEKDFNDIKKGMHDKKEKLNRLENDILELDKDTVQKQFSFLNRYIIFKKK
tara:strand:- start:2060 stop:4999 length:2940 start_codon:yes stop_codon:yes gene_type:complete